MKRGRNASSCLPVHPWLPEAEKSVKDAVAQVAEVPFVILEKCYFWRPTKTAPFFSDVVGPEYLFPPQCPPSFQALCFNAAFWLQNLIVFSRHGIVSEWTIQTVKPLNLSQQVPSLGFLQAGNQVAASTPVTRNCWTKAFIFLSQGPPKVACPWHWWAGCRRPMGCSSSSSRGCQKVAQRTWRYWFMKRIYLATRGPCLILTTLLFWVWRKAGFIDWSPWLQEPQVSSMMRLDLTLLSSNQPLQSKCVGLCSNSGAVTETELSCAQLNTNKPIGWRLLCLVDYTRLVNDESPELVSISVSLNLMKSSLTCRAQRYVWHALHLSWHQTTSLASLVSLGLVMRQKGTCWSVHFVQTDPQALW